MLLQDPSEDGLSLNGFQEVTELYFVQQQLHVRHLSSVWRRTLLEGELGLQLGLRGFHHVVVLVRSEAALIKLA